MADEKKINALGKEVAYNLADITKTRPQTAVFSRKNLRTMSWPGVRYAVESASSAETRA